jgi:hypothetical protein
MDSTEARALAERRLEQLRTLSYDELVARFLNRDEGGEIGGPSGTRYQLEVRAFWDDKEARHLRVRAAIDDGGWRAFMPLITDFIIGPDGTFVGE